MLKNPSLEWGWAASLLTECELVEKWTNIICFISGLAFPLPSSAVFYWQNKNQIKEKRVIHAALTWSQALRGITALFFLHQKISFLTFLWQTLCGTSPTAHPQPSRGWPWCTGRTLSTKENLPWRNLLKADSPAGPTAAPVQALARLGVLLDGSSASEDFFGSLSSFRVAWLRNQWEEALHLQARPWPWRSLNEPPPTFCLIPFGSGRKWEQPVWCPTLYNVV